MYSKMFILPIRLCTMHRRLQILKSSKHTQRAYTKTSELYGEWLRCSRMNYQNYLTRKTQNTCFISQARDSRYSMLWVDTLPRPSYIAGSTEIVPSFQKQLKKLHHTREAWLTTRLESTLRNDIDLGPAVHKLDKLSLRVWSQSSYICVWENQIVSV